MRNFEVTTIDGDKYWISRSVAICAIIFKQDALGNICVLANKRGKGTPDFQGFWNCPCGYLDFNETLKEACAREVAEECGIKISPNHFILTGIEDSPNANRQNVIVRFTAYVCDKDLEYVKVEGGEKNEVEDIRWISISNLHKYNWAFNHKELITSIAKIHLIGSC